MGGALQPRRALRELADTGFHEVLSASAPRICQDCQVETGSDEVGERNGDDRRNSAPTSIIIWSALVHCPATSSIVGVALGATSTHRTRMPRYFDIEVNLVLPRRVWRRFLLHKAATFAELHAAIQAAFGWQDYHLYEFRHPGDRNWVLAGLPDLNDFEDRKIPDAKKAHIKDHFWGRGMSPPSWFEYEYDFGDSWIHEVKLRGEVSIPETFKRRLLNGERAAPPEDCGGDGGYERMVSVVEHDIDPWDELEEIKRWLGDWDPERFDLEAAAEAFNRPESRRSRKTAQPMQH
jgi:hypothetical protein